MAKNHTTPVTQTTTASLTGSGCQNYFAHILLYLVAGKIGHSPVTSGNIRYYFITYETIVREVNLYIFLVCMSIIFNKSGFYASYSKIKGEYGDLRRKKKILKEVKTPQFYSDSKTEINYHKLIIEIKRLGYYCAPFRYVPLNA